MKKNKAAAEAIASAKKLGERADKAIVVSQRIFPGAPNAVIEQQAVELLKLSDQTLNAIQLIQGVNMSEAFEKHRKEYFKSISKYPADIQEALNPTIEGADVRIYIGCEKLSEFDFYNMEDKRSGLDDPNNWIIVERTLDNQGQKNWYRVLHKRLCAKISDPHKLIDELHYVKTLDREDSFEYYQCLMKTKKRKKTKS